MKVNNITIKMFDLAGQESMRGVWKYYFSSTEGVIFVVDASRKDRFADVKEELYNILNDENAQFFMLPPDSGLSHARNTLVYRIPVPFSLDLSRMDVLVLFFCSSACALDVENLCRRF